LEAQFTQNLLKWHKSVRRSLPWKQDNDPYKIWVSEIILQQTQVAQGIPYYNKFIQKFPDIKTLATSELDEVLALWKGLGYYSRARNIHKAATTILEKHGGIFPKQFEEVKALAGIGDYTASAICSFAYNQVYAVVDANVIRVIARYYCLKEEVHKSQSIKDIKVKANALLAQERPGDYNQAIMDFGALVCRPKDPNCDSCIMQENCLAKQEGIAKLLPKKKTKKQRRERYFHYLDLNLTNSFLIRQRNEKDIWHSLYELPYIETKSKRAISLKRIASFLKEQLGDIEIQTVDKINKSYKQTLSHQYIHGLFYHVHIKGNLPPLRAAYLHVSSKKLEKMAIPKLIDWYISQKPITL